MAKMRNWDLYILDTSLKKKHCNRKLELNWWREYGKVLVFWKLCGTFYPNIFYIKLAECVDMVKILLNHHHKQDLMLEYLHEENKLHDWSCKIRQGWFYLQGE